MASSVLIVDDEKELRELLSILLKRAGFETRTAAHGLEAMAFIEAARPHLIISDVRMPICDGYEFTKKLLALQGPPIPILYMSGFMGDSDLELHRNPGFKGFAAKPIRSRDLITLVETILAQQEPSASD